MIEFACRLSRPQLEFDVAFASTAKVTGLIGASGSGKSTVIQLIAGLISPAQGRIALDGRTLLDTAQRVSVAPHKRHIGLVFQDAQLFPHLSVEKNLTYGRYFSPTRTTDMPFETVVEVLGIGHLLRRSTSTLSGGERQRVAIGRAVLGAPSLLLLDEPLASLDGGRKLEILPFIERLRDEFSIPMLYVTHAVEEVSRLAGTVVRISAGKVVAAGPPAEVLSAGLLAEASERFDTLSIIVGRFERFDPDYGVSVVAHPAGSITVPGRIGASPGANIRIGIRATNVSIGTIRPEGISIRTMLQGRIAELRETGPLAHVAIDLSGGDRIMAYVTKLAARELGLEVGKATVALVKSVAISEGGITGMLPGKGE